MSLLSTVVTGLSKAENFLVNVFTKGTQVVAVLSKLSAPTIAALLAVFYDTMKTVLSAEAAAQAASSGNFTGAVTLSQATIALVKNVAADAVAGEKQIVADLEALGIAVSAPAATAAVV